MSMVGSSCDMSLARPQPRVEDEVEEVHDQVGEDHADGENDQDSLGERVVVPEHGLLEREADARIAEDELDEDEPAYGAGEEGRKAVQRGKDGVPSRVA